MQRTDTTLMPPDKGYAIGATSRMVDLRQGGMGGFGPDYTELVSAAVHIRKPVIPVLLRAPSGFDLLPNPEYWYGTLRAILEEGFQSIDGLRTGREYEFSQTPVGGAGEIQEDVTNATIPRSEVVYNIRERYGMAVNSFVTQYGDKLMMHPEIKYATLATLSGAGPTDMLPDRYTFMMLFMEPDPTHQFVVNAWVGDYMMFRTAGTVEGKRDMTQAGEPIDHQLGLTGVYQSNNAGVKAFAQSILSSMTIVGADPNNRGLGISGVDINVSSKLVGYKDQIERFRASSVLPI